MNSYKELKKDTARGVLVVGGIFIVLLILLMILI